jgi:RimJ/RimL family protein N-acetyltransferase
MPDWKIGAERYRYTRAEDMPAIHDLLADPEVQRYLWFVPAPPAVIDEYFGPLLAAQAAALERDEMPGNVVISVMDERGSFLGHGGIVEVLGSPGGFEIGFQLGRNAWGRGVGSRLGRFLTAFAVHRLGAERIEGSCFADNVASARILSKVGLATEGRKVGYRVKEDRRHDELFFGAPVADLDVVALEALARESGLIAG